MFGIPVAPRDYSDFKQVELGVKNILEVIKPGDIINIQARLDSWWDIEMSFAWRIILDDQKYVFGPMSRYTDEHTVLYLDPDNVFTMEPPHAIFRHLRDYALDNISLYRYQKAKYTEISGDTMNADDIAELRRLSTRLSGTEYHIPQLVNILVNTILEFPSTEKFNIFKKGFVCSVAARALFEKWRKNYNKNRKEGMKKIPRLFSKLNPNHEFTNRLFNRHFKDKKRPGVDIEMTSPAHFANSEFFDSEFELIAQFDNGVRM